MFLICYDIEDDKSRTKIAATLTKNGLERLQYSVFIGELSDAKLKLIENALNTLLEKKPSPNDSIVIFPMHEDALNDTITLGKSLDYFLKPPNTLFFE